MVSMLFRIARAAAWGRAISKAAEGNPLPLVRRVRNRYAYRALGNALRKLKP